MEPGNYRRITLLNADYKILTCILTNITPATLSKVLHPGPYSGGTGRNIFDAIAFIRDTLAYAQLKNNCLCILSLDFEAAFDKKSHQYLFRLLEAYGYSDNLYKSCMMVRSSRHR